MTGISRMTDADLWLAIAEMLGWKHYDYKECPRVMCGSGRISQAHWHDGISDDIYALPTGDRIDVLSNWPCNVAAAMRLEDLFQDDKERAIYAIHLAAIVDVGIPLSVSRSVYNRYYWLAHATARQRSEAWLKTKREE